MLSRITRNQNATKDMLLRDNRDNSAKAFNLLQAKLPNPTTTMMFIVDDEDNDEDVSVDYSRENARYCAPNADTRRMRAEII